MFRKAIHLKTCELLGEGSQGRVFKALRVDSATGMRQLVALKVLHSETAVELWRQEFESLAKVRSPYCVQVLSFERVDGRPALIMEYVEGASLNLLNQSHPFTVEETGEIAAQLESALRDLQTQRLAHGDLSPQNVMLDIHGRVRVLDFGLANSDRVTVDFAAPEVLNGQAADFQSDLYSLGKLCERLSAAAEPWQSYLEPQASARCLRNQSPCLRIQASLALRVRDWQRRSRATSEQKTVALDAQRPKPWLAQHLLLLTITFCLFGFQPSADSSKRTPLVRALVLRLRTKSWHRFWLNGQPLGYAPLNVVLEPKQSYQLQWQSARGQGTRHLQPNGDLRLQDSDFLH